jgi:integrase
MSLHLRKRGAVWHCRGTVPSRQADGKIRRVRIEQSTYAESKVRAQKVAADLERYYHDLAYGNIKERGPTFAEAAITYIQTRGKSDRFITKLIKFFGETPIADIDQAAAAGAAHQLYPSLSPATHNRAVFTPLSAILRMAGGDGHFRRPHIGDGAVAIPDDAWFEAVLPHCPPKLAALVLFLTLTGRRVGEVLALTENDIDDQGRAHIHRTKTGVPVMVAVPELCMALLRDADGYYRRKGTGQPSKRLFGYARLPAAHKALHRVCDRAGLPFYGFHAIGRHSFATRTLKSGKSIKWVKEAGGWKSLRSLERYLHLEQSEVQREREILGQEWGKRFAPKKQNPGNKGDADAE